MMCLDVPRRNYNYYHAHHLNMLLGMANIHELSGVLVGVYKVANDDRD